MKTIKLDNRKIKSFVLLFFLSLSVFPAFLLSNSNTPSVNLSLIENENLNFIYFEDIDLDLGSQDSKSIQSDDNNWNRVIPNFDRNANGLSDQFEIKFFASKESVGEESFVMPEGVEVISNNNEKSLNRITYNRISVIVQFPETYDYSNVLSLFEEQGGTVKSTYKDIINGFVGDINRNNFELFYEQIQSKNIPFLIEENGVVESTLYTASRNMGLRPYTWNTLGYTGDDESSIAVLDTGIDDSHDFFSYTTPEDFNSKIVGWQDFVNGINGNPYDDGAHGTHCSGIAAGDGDINLDGSGRTVATVVPDLNFTGEGLYDGWGFGKRPIEFNVTDDTTGFIRIECNFTDYTATADEMHGYIALYRGNTEVNYTYSSSTNWEYVIVHEVTPATVGTYSLEVIVVADDNNGDGVVLNPVSRFRAKIHWDYNPPLYGCGNAFKGIAPDAHLVGVKVLDENGNGDMSDILQAYQWVYDYRETYNITVVSLSYGGSSYAAEITAVNNLVEKGGIVVVAAAGNDYTGSNKIGSPGDADNVITVAAMNYNDQITDYSSQGGLGALSNTTKPDITAPGGSHYGYPMLSSDTDNNTAEGLYPTDDYDDDLSPMQGTSMATPAVAGAASLLIEAMGGGNSWDWYSGADAKLVKALLLMTATETYPLKREDDASHSPALDRGGKDVHEGYGRINIDAAIEAWTKQFTISFNSTEDIIIQLNTSAYNPAGKHAYARYVDLNAGQWYAFNLTVPAGADYDIYLYNDSSTEWGEPDLIAWSTSSARGGYEVLNYTAEKTDRYFLVIKAIGYARPAGAAAEEEDDDGSKSTKETIDILDFLMSPLGMLIIFSSVAAVIATVCISKISRGGSRGSKTSQSEQERIDSIIGGHDY